MKDNTVCVEVQKIIQILVLFVSNCYKVIKITGFRSACKYVIVRIKQYNKYVY